MARRQLERGYDSDSSGEGAYDSDGEARVSESEQEEEIQMEVEPELNEESEDDLFASEDEKASNADDIGKDIRTENYVDNNDDFHAENYVDDGPPVSAFNGDFSESDKESDKDDWDYSDNDVKSTAHAHQKQLDQTISRQKALQEELESIDVTELVELLVSFLEPSETPLEALARLGPPLKRHHGRRKKNNSASSDDSLESNRKFKVTQITETCTKLERHGIVRSSVYDTSREELMRLSRAAASTRGVKRTRDETETEDSNPYYDLKQWEFKWNEDDVVLGPYTSYEMDYWKEQGHFNDTVVVRKSRGPFMSITTIEKFR
ncbi:uncharacterized protein KQ657_001927 [Scheffersomyces spartinae]|uniref:GYF domain-containing protein n=1 Tax=Scheffersomyces spartinae TaxID=45513 RepID=A0A9P8AHJ3_9ASCO|nr:uncharacterized protein KQ657_001927 [Scheffersomyces spartinae]KAG7192209.1 hypothetical protein KQ657_001927 [Scheffersomyces spartinae]